VDEETIVDKLDGLVIENDILPVRVSRECMSKGKKNTPGYCPGALAIGAALGREDMSGIKIAVGHKTKEHLSNRVVIKVVEEPSYKYIGWIANSEGKSGFHPQRFDSGKQKNPGAMMIERWAKEPVAPMPLEKAAELHRPEARQRRREILKDIESNGMRRVYNVY
jgi:hypothetical protein